MIFSHVVDKFTGEKCRAIRCAYPNSPAEVAEFTGGGITPRESGKHHGISIYVPVDEPAQTGEPGDSVIMATRRETANFGDYIVIHDGYDTIHTLAEFEAQYRVDRQEISGPDRSW